jgi:uncharacterized membrane protein YkvA (DUF1232 family)
MRLPSLARAREVLFEVPRTGKLAYCLMRDRRVPLGPKIATGIAVGLVVSPLDVPAWVPVIGDLDMLALGILAVKVFVDACPEKVVEEHRDALEVGESVFDRDLQVALTLARESVRRLAARRAERLALSGSHHGPAPAGGRELQEERLA